MSTLRQFSWLAVACLPACVTGDYAMDRARDLGDVVRGHVMAGVGFDASVEATTFVKVGFGYYEANALGLGDRYAGTWHEYVVDIGVLTYGAHREHLDGAPRITGDHIFDLGAAFDGKDPVYESEALRPADWCTLRATAFLFVGVDVELRLGEVLDLLVGLFGKDLSGDDAEWPPPDLAAAPAPAGASGLAGLVSSPWPK